MEQLIIQDCSPNKLIADSVLKAAVDLWAKAVSVEELKYLQLPFPVDVEFRHPAVQPHKNTTRVLERTDEAADQLVGDSFCELLEWKQKEEEIKLSVTLRNSADQLEKEHNNVTCLEWMYQ